MKSCWTSSNSLLPWQPRTYHITSGKLVLSPSWVSKLSFRLFLYCSVIYLELWLKNISNPSWDWAGLGCRFEKSIYCERYLPTCTGLWASHAHRKTCAYMLQNSLILSFNKNFMKIFVHIIWMLQILLKIIQKSSKLRGWPNF